MHNVINTELVPLCHYRVQLRLVPSFYWLHVRDAGRIFIWGFFLASPAPAMGEGSPNNDSKDKNGRNTTDHYSYDGPMVQAAAILILF